MRPNNSQIIGDILNGIIALPQDSRDESDPEVTRGRLYQQVRQYADLFPGGWAAAVRAAERKERASGRVTRDESSKRYPKTLGNRRYTRDEILSKLAAIPIGERIPAKMTKKHRAVATMIKRRPDEFPDGLVGAFAEIGYAYDPGKTGTYHHYTRDGLIDIGVSWKQEGLSTTSSSVQRDPARRRLYRAIHRRFQWSEFVEAVEERYRESLRE